MVRQAGIPSRVAFGFSRGTPSANEKNTWILTNQNLHAWTEVYFGGRIGWVPFDATPASSVAGSTRTDWAPDNAKPVPTASASGPTAGPNVTASGNPAAANRPDKDIGQGSAGAIDNSAAGGTSYGNTLWVVSLIALVLALLAVPALRRALVRRRRHAATTVRAAAALAPPGDAPPGPPGMVVTSVEVVQAREDAHAAWDELVDTLVDFRVTVDPTETPRHTAQRLVKESELVGPAADAATLLGRAEERARYARAPMEGGELTAALRQVHRALATRADRRTRLAAFLLPPSVMLRWRLGMADLSGRWVGSLSRRREAASRFNPRRMLANRTR
jgi:hypothetical protein